MTNFNELSDNLLTQIKNYIDYEINQGVRLDSAIVSKVHTDGTVDIYFPPDKNKIFTKVQNQSIYQNLQPGDGVKVIYENGSESSCWIIGKHKGINIQSNSEKVTSNSNIDLSGKLNISGGTMTGKLFAQSNSDYSTGQVRNIFVLPDIPSDSVGENGDICIVYGG